MEGSNAANSDTLSRVRQVALADRVVRDVLMTIGDSDREGSEIAVEEIENIFPGEHTRRSVIAGFKALASTGVATFVTGRHGYPSRLVWTTEPSSLPDALRPTPTEGDSEPSEQSHNGSDALGETHLVGHLFELREDATIALTLPSDLSQAEAARLAAWIRSLV